MQAVEDGSKQPGHTEKPDRGRNEADHLHCQGQEGWVQIVETASQQPGHLRRGELQEQDDPGQCHRQQADQCAHQPHQFSPTFGPGVVAQHRHKRRAQHPADEEVVEHCGHKAGNGEGADQPAGAKDGVDDHLAQESQHPAGDIADREEGGAAGQTGVRGGRSGLGGGFV